MKHYLWFGILFVLAGCASDPVEPGDSTDGVQVIVDPALQPMRDSLKPYKPGGPVRPVASTHFGDEAFQADFVSDEIIVRARLSEVEDLVEDWNGEIVRRIEPEGELDIDPAYVVRLDPSQLQVPSIRESLGELVPTAQGRLRVSSEQGADLIAVAALAARDGVNADLNWLASPDQVQTFEGRVTREHETSPGSYENAFTETYMLTTGSQRTGVGDAWLALERAGRLNNRVTIGVIDGGFSVNPDFPASLQSFSESPLSNGLEDPNPGNCTGGAACPWHGTGAVGAAMGLPDNEYGGAGPGGPVANAVTVLTQFDIGSIQWALVRLASRAYVINMSFGGTYSGSWAGWGFDDYARFVRDVYANGNFMVASAGNNDIDIDDGETVLSDPAVKAPCEFMGVTCVGALSDNATTRIWYSNYGGNHVSSGVVSDGTVDIFAPTNITVGGNPDSPSPNTFGGTSAASPFTAGIVALIKAADPSRSVFDVQDLLIQNAHTGSSDPDVPRWVNALGSVIAAIDTESPTFLRINEPVEGATYDEGRRIRFHATVDDLDNDLGDFDIRWFYDRMGTPYTFLNTVSGELQLRTPFCDGNWTISAKAVDSLTGASASDTVTVTVSNPATGDPPAQCAPSVEIVEPQPGSTFVAGAPITFRARFDDDHPETDDPIYPVRWLLGDQSGFVFDEGAEVSRSFGENPNQMVTVTYGAASTSVTFAVIETTNEPPTATITMPEDGARIVDFSNQPDVDVDVTGSGQDAEDGTLGGTSLEWSYRRAGSQNWNSGGSGTSQTLTLRDNQCNSDTTYDVRLTATDSEGLSDSVIIQVNVRGYIC